MNWGMVMFGVIFPLFAIDFVCPNRETRDLSVLVWRLVNITGIQSRGATSPERQTVRVTAWKVAHAYCGDGAHPSGGLLPKGRWGTQCATAAVALWDADAMRPASALQDGVRLAGDCMMRCVATRRWHGQCAGGQMLVRRYHGHGAAERQANSQGPSCRHELPDTLRDEYCTAATSMLSLLPGPRDDPSVKWCGAGLMVLQSAMSMPNSPHHDDMAVGQRLRALCCGHAVRMVLNPSGNLEAAPCCRKVIVQASFHTLVKPGNEENEEHECQLSPSGPGAGAQWIGEVLESFG
ncbi:hypothetical protein C8R45DRAFT_935318 [Mycena sanguinolenta]|nr:hypothetical protein C8R45DRAFT_935318 [Mycena sanguinolenta]